jgi:hypothetical protein
MPLVSSISEVRKFIKTAGAKDNSILPDFLRAEHAYIEPLLGSELYEELQNFYNNGTFNQDDLKGRLILLAQRPIVAFSYHDELPLLHTLITDLGVRRASTNNLPAAYKWEFKELKNALLDMAYHGIEQMLQFLFKNVDELDSFRSSDYFKMIEGLPVKSGTHFNQLYKLYQPLRTFSAILPIQQMVKDLYLNSEFGEALATHICEYSGNESSMLGVKKLVEKSTAYYTIKHACEQFAVRFSVHGFTVVSDIDKDDPEAGFDNASLQAIELKMKAADRDGGTYLSKARAALIKLIEDKQLEPDFSDDFKNAIDDSPLKDVALNAILDRDLGNNRRKIFRL